MSIVTILIHLIIQVSPIKNILYIFNTYIRILHYISSENTL